MGSSLGLSALQRGVRSRRTSCAPSATRSERTVGVSAAVLAWILDQVVIRANTELPGVGAAELDRFRQELVRRLRALARPSDG